MQETGLCSLGQEDSPGKGVTTHPSILAWRIPRAEEPGRLQSMNEWLTHTHTHTLGLPRLSPFSVHFLTALQHLCRGGSNPTQVSLPWLVLRLIRSLLPPKWALSCWWERDGSHGVSIHTAEGVGIGDSLQLGIQGQ